MIRRSAHLLSPLLASLSPPLHALVCDVTLISSVILVTKSLHLPNYIFFTSSAKMSSFFSYFHIYASKVGDDDLAMLGDVEIPGLPSIPRSSIPHLLLIPNNIFANIFKVDSPKVTKSNGVLINTFEGFETPSLELLNGRKVVEGMPPVFAVGPFVPCDFEKGELEESCDEEWNYSAFMAITPVDSLEDLSTLVEELNEHTKVESMGIEEESNNEDERVKGLQESYDSLLEKTGKYARVAKAAIRKMKKAEQDYKNILMRYKETKCEVKVMNEELTNA
ncbi:hypothetical protein SO802_011313 [Lithocarpus litseifolius]|uniref:Uncharacterized protein n=1 Tax=Lithocarpus litseifolius TaxID=425828 RepID=A0AAW2D1P9_9ROSI